MPGPPGPPGQGAHHALAWTCHHGECPSCGKFGGEEGGGYSAGEIPPPRRSEGNRRHWYPLYWHCWALVSAARESGYTGIRSLCEPLQRVEESGYRRRTVLRWFGTATVQPPQTAAVAVVRTPASRVGRGWRPGPCPASALVRARRWTSGRWKCELAEFVDRRLSCAKASCCLFCRMCHAAGKHDEQATVFAR
jgi:hypothetical protein